MKQKRCALMKFVLIIIAVSLVFAGCNRNVVETESEHEHDFTCKVIAEEYFKSDATCTDGKQYYFSCECGEKGEEAFSEGLSLEHDYSAEVVRDEYLKSPATCGTAASYYKSCVLCGKKTWKIFYSGDPTGDHKYTEQIVDDKYIKKSATFESGPVYYKSCVCGKKGTETFVYGLPLSEGCIPTSLTVSLYDSANSIYGFTFNTQIRPITPVIQIEMGDSLTASMEEYAATVTEATSYDANDKEFTYYIVKAEVELEANKTYAYRAYDKGANVGTAQATLKTKDTNSNSFTFAHLSDSQGNGEYFGDVLEQVTKTSDLIIHTGDVVESSMHEQDWEAMLDDNFEYLSQIPIMAISGNHETTYKNGSNETFKHFNYLLPDQASTNKGIFYSFVYGNVKFIMLNTNDLTSNQLKLEQYNWLISELENNTATWTVVAMHNPMYSVGKYGMDSTKNQICLTLRNQLQGIFAQYGVDIVLQGHDHAISRTYPIDGSGVAQTETWRTDDCVQYSVDPSGVIYVMNGPAGPQSRAPYDTDDSIYEYAEGSYTRSWAEFTVEGNKMTVTVKYTDGTTTNVYHTWGILKTEN